MKLRFYSILFMHHWVGETDKAGHLVAGDTAFYLAFSCMFMAYLTAESWGGPSASMMQSLLPAPMQGSGFALYFCLTTLLSGGGSEVVGLFPPQDVDGKPAQAWVIFINVAASYGGAALLWFASLAYLKKDVVAKEIFVKTRQMPTVSRTRWILVGILAVVTVVIAIVLTVASILKDGKAVDTHALHSLSASLSASPASTPMHSLSGSPAM
jgi:hypothetical protein